MDKHSTPLYQGPLRERREAEREAWRRRVDQAAAKLSRPLSRSRYVFHPVTGELCELR